MGTRRRKPDWALDDQAPSCSICGADFPLVNLCETDFICDSCFEAVIAVQPPEDTMCPVCETEPMLFPTETLRQLFNLDVMERQAAIDEAKAELAAARASAEIEEQRKLAAEAEVEEARVVLKTLRNMEQSPQVILPPSLGMWQQHAHVPSPMLRYLRGPPKGRSRRRITVKNLLAFIVDIYEQKMLSESAQQKRIRQQLDALTSTAAPPTFPPPATTSSASVVAANPSTVPGGTDVFMTSLSSSMTGGASVGDGPVTSSGLPVPSTAFGGHNSRHLRQADSTLAAFVIEQVRAKQAYRALAEDVLYSVADGCVRFASYPRIAMFGLLLGISGRGAAAAAAQQHQGARVARAARAKAEEEAAAVAAAADGDTSVSAAEETSSAAAQSLVGSVSGGSRPSSAAVSVRQAKEAEEAAAVAVAEAADEPTVIITSKTSSNVLSLLRVVNAPSSTPWNTDYVYPPQLGTVFCALLKHLFPNTEVLRERLDRASGDCWLKREDAITAVHNMFLKNNRWKLSEFHEGIAEFNVSSPWPDSARVLLMSAVEALCESISGKGYLGVQFAGTQYVVDFDKFMRCVVLTYMDKHRHLVELLHRAEAKLITKHKAERSEYLRLVRIAQIRPFTDEDVEQIRRGVATHGEDWTTILADPDIGIQYRTAVMCAPTWRRVREEEERKERLEWNWYNWDWDPDWEWGALYACTDTESDTDDDDDGVWLSDSSTGSGGEAGVALLPVKLGRRLSTQSSATQGSIKGSAPSSSRGSDHGGNSPAAAAPVTLSFRSGGTGGPSTPVSVSSAAVAAGLSPQKVGMVGIGLWSPPRRPRGEREPPGGFWDATGGRVHPTSATDSSTPLSTAARNPWQWNQSSTATVATVAGSGSGSKGGGIRSSQNGKHQKGGTKRRRRRRRRAARGTSSSGISGNGGVSGHSSPSADSDAAPRSPSSATAVAAASFFGGTPGKKSGSTTLSASVSGNRGLSVRDRRGRKALAPLNMRSRNKSSTATSPANGAPSSGAAARANARIRRTPVNGGGKTTPSSVARRTPVGSRSNRGKGTIAAGRVSRSGSVRGGFGAGVPAADLTDQTPALPSSCPQDDSALPSLPLNLLRPSTAPPPTPSRVSHSLVLSGSRNSSLAGLARWGRRKGWQHASSPNTIVRNAMATAASATEHATMAGKHRGAFSRSVDAHGDDAGTALDEESDEDSVMGSVRVGDVKPLHVGHYSGGDAGTVELMERMDNDSHRLQEVNAIVLRENGVRERGCISLCRTIMYNSLLSITTLDLAHNRIGTRGAQALADLLAIDRKQAYAPLLAAGNAAWTARRRQPARRGRSVAAHQARIAAAAVAASHAVAVDRELMPLPIADLEGLLVDPFRRVRELARLRRMPTSAATAGFVPLHSNNASRGVRRSLERGASGSGGSLAGGVSKARQSAGNTVGGGKGSRRATLHTPPAGRNLRFRCPLRELDLSTNRLGDSAIVCLAQGLLCNTSLRQLNLSHCGVRSVQPLAHALAQHPTLLHVNLAWNLLRDSHAALLGVALGHSMNLRTIELQFNSFGQRGAEALAHALVTNISITFLDASYNSLPSASAFTLAHAIRDSVGISPIKYLQLNGNNFSQEAIRALLDASVCQPGRELNVGVEGCGVAATPRPSTAGSTKSMLPRKSHNSKSVGALPPRTPPTIQLTLRPRQPLQGTLTVASLHSDGDSVAESDTNRTASSSIALGEPQAKQEVAPLLQQTSSLPLLITDD